MIYDLHCDLLCYLKGGPKRTAYDPAVRCSIPQLRQGGVGLQIMAIFSETIPQSAASGLAQAQMFGKLPSLYPLDFQRIHSNEDIGIACSRKAIGILAAIENASSFSDEQEPFEECIARLNTIRKLCGTIVYISLTWNIENRFGGGAHSHVGLKEDGKKLIDFLHAKNIAVDLSHASDFLVVDIFNYLDRQNYQIPVLASHSNFRKVADVPRNLPEELAKEIVRRKGIIGLNFVRSFIGEKDPFNLVKQLEYGLELGMSENLCFGADFYFLEDVPLPYRKSEQQAFFPSFSDASAYGKVIDLWKKSLRLSDHLLYGVRCGNLHSYLAKNILEHV